MAFAFDVSTTRYQEGGRWYRVVEVSATDVAAGDEIQVENMPAVGTIIACRWDPPVGTATTFAPKIYKAEDTDTKLDEVAVYDAAAGDNVADEAVWVGGDGSLWIRATPDAGTDNALELELVILEGYR